MVVVAAKWRFAHRPVRASLDALWLGRILTLSAPLFHIVDRNALRLCGFQAAFKCRDAFDLRTVTSYRSWPARRCWLATRWPGRRSSCSGRRRHQSRRSSRNRCALVTDSQALMIRVCANARTRAHEEKSVQEGQNQKKKSVSMTKFLLLCKSLHQLSDCFI